MMIPLKLPVPGDIPDIPRLIFFGGSKQANPTYELVYKDLIKHSYVLHELTIVHYNR